MMDIIMVRHCATSIIENNRIVVAPLNPSRLFLRNIRRDERI